MSPSHVAEPTLEAIRNRLTAGAWPMGHRLEAGRLAEEFGVSITPVRDSLNRLVGEGLVDLLPGIGFHVPRLTERELRELLDLNLVLLLGAVRIGTAFDGRAAAEPPTGEHAARTNALFSRIAAWSGNAELVDFVRAISARLYPMRLHELLVLPNAVKDLELIEAAWLASPGRLSNALRRYHEVRRAAADRLIARLQAASAV